MKNLFKVIKQGLTIKKGPRLGQTLRVLCVSVVNKVAEVGGTIRKIRTISGLKGEKTMKVYYDKEVDAAYIKLSERTPTGVIEISEGINIDVTDEGEVIGIEMLNASDKFPLKTLFTWEYDSELLLNRESLSHIESGT